MASDRALLHGPISRSKIGSHRASNLARLRVMFRCLGPSAGAGVFDPGAAGQLYRKCLGRRDEAQFSNADNMALVGILSTQLLHEAFIGSGFRAVRPATFHTVADRLQEGPA